MAFTEIKERNGKKYYYRVISFRKGDKVSKKRIYLGANISRQILSLKESKADKELRVLSINPNRKNLRDLEKIKSIIIKVLRANHIKKAGIFGSYATGENKKNSDVDILIKPTKGMGFAFAGLEIQLKEALGKKVDLVSYNGINHLLRKRILSQEVRII